MTLNLPTYKFRHCNTLSASTTNVPLIEAVNIIGVKCRVSRKFYFDAKLNYGSRGERNVAGADQTSAINPQSSIVCSVASELRKTS